MIQITTITIVLSGVVLFLALVSSILNPFLRVPLKHKDEEEVDEKEMPPLSVIIRIGDDIDMLERNIDLFLKQRYDAGFQLILVANEGDSRADDMMKRYAGKADMKSTFIPSTSRYLSRGKLGVTLGVKAASHDWCVLINASCYPESDQWLRNIGRRCCGETNLVIGYSNYDNESKVFQRFSRMRQFAIGWFECLHATAYAANSKNVAFRKSEFIGQDGYRGNLDSIHGEYDFLVNKLAQRKKTAVVTNTEGRLTEKAPIKKEWHRQRMYSIDARQTMKRHFSHALLPMLDNIFLHLAWIAALALAAYSGIVLNWITLGAAVVAILMLTIWRTLLDAKAVRYFSAGISAWTLLYFELTAHWHTLADKVRYRFTSKNNFTSHKL